MHPAHFFRSFLVILLLAPALAAQEKPVATAGQPLSVVRVNATSQAYDFFRPWSKKPAFTRRGLGAVLADDKVLVVAEMVANQSYIELEKASSGEKVVADLVAVDYEANLALLAPREPKFLDNLPPLATSKQQVKTGDRIDIWQLENSGTLVATSGLITSAEVGRYAIDDYGFLLYKITAALQYRDNSFSVPLVRDGKLAGLLLRFDPRSQTIEAISLPVIQHFLKDAADLPYQGFPRVGIRFDATRDPQFRRFLQLPANGGGVYLNNVDSSTAAAAAGLQAGDVVLKVGDKTIDPDGNYDHPIFGKIAISHFITTESQVGDTLKVQYSRAGEIRETTLTAAARPPQDFTIEPYTYDRAPRFILLSGLLFQELSRQYLREWGGDWRKTAPLAFVYLDRYQNELFQPDRGRVVILSQVLAVPATIGYERVGQSVVEKVNDRPIRGIADLDVALKSPIDGFHKIEIQDDPRTLYLDAKTAADATESLRQQYGLPITSRLLEK